MSLSFQRGSRADAEWRERLQQKLQKLEQLPPGSDSWSPHRPKMEILAAARQISEDAGRCGRFVSIIAATSEGGIQLKWQDLQKELSLLIYPDQTVEYLFVRRDREERQSGQLPDVHRAGDFVSDRLK